MEDDCGINFYEMTKAIIEAKWPILACAFIPAFFAFLFNEVKSRQYKTEVLVLFSKESKDWRMIQRRILQSESVYSYMADKCGSEAVRGFKVNPIEYALSVEFTNDSKIKADCIADASVEAYRKKIDEINATMPEFQEKSPKFMFADKRVSGVSVGIDGIINSGFLGLIIGILVAFGINKYKKDEAMFRKDQI